MRNCDQFREMYEAYALGALDADERAAFEAHLATGCAECAKGVEEARWLVSQLAYLAPEAGPSDMLKGRLMQTVRADAGADSREVATESAKRGAPVWLFLAAAAMLLFAVYSEWDSRRMAEQVRNAQEQTAKILAEHAQIEKQLAIAKQEAAILTDPGSVKIALASMDKATPAMEAMWHSQLGIVLSGQSMPMPSGDRVLQLWLIPKVAGGKPIPSMTLRPDANGKFVLLVFNPPELMAETKALAVTEEPAGGSLQPTSAPRWVGGVS